MATLAERFAAAEAESNSRRLEAGQAPATGGPLTVSNLLDDDKWGTVSAYMEDRTGMTERDYSREEIRDAFVNSMRGFSSGNSLDVIQEMNHLYQGEGDELEQRRATAGAAYDLWDSLGGAFNENTSLGEKADAVGDYAWSLIMDPVNIAGGVAGKLGGQVATRASSAGVKALAQTAGRAAAARATGRGLTGEAVALAARQAQAGVMHRGFQGLAATGGQAAVTSAVRRQAVGSIAAGAVFDSAAGTIADAGIQKVDRMTGRQEGYNVTQGALSGVGGLVGAGIQGGILLGRSWSPFKETAGTLIDRAEATFEANLARVAEAEGAAKQLAAAASGNSAEALQQRLTNLLTPFEELVEAGTKVDAGDTVASDSFKLYAGLRDFFNEAGIPIDSLNSRLGQRRAGWYRDVLADENFPTQWRGQIEDVLTRRFKDSSGNQMSLDDIMLKGAERASIWGQQGRMLGAAKRATGNVIPDKDAVAKGLDDMTGGRRIVDGEDGTDKVKEWFTHAQNNFIRMLVTHPATTALNVVGWAQASGMQAATDMIRGTLYGGWSVLKYTTGDAMGAAQYRQFSKNSFNALKFKLRTLVDPMGTAEETLEFLMHRPEAQKKLFSYLSGGIENGDTVANLNRILDDAPDPRTGVTKAMDFMQTAYGVTAQDVLTKSHEFMSALNHNLLDEYGMDYMTFMQREDLFTILKDPQKGASYEAFMRVEGQAVEQALGNVFARKLGKTGGTHLEFVADILEKSRNVPVLGALVPFGQFFNNSMVFMADHTGISFVLKPYTRTSKTYLELLARSAAGYSLIAVATIKEMDNLKEGLAWFEERNADGKVVSRLNDFPLSFWKIIGRMGAHVIDPQGNGHVPAPLFEEFTKTFTLASVTRGLGDAAGGVQQLATDIFAGEAGYADVIPAVLSSTTNLYLSGGSRFLDPINTAIAFSEGEDYVTPTRTIGNKHLNNALRYTDQIVDSLIGLENIPVVGEGIARAYSTQNYSMTADRNIGVNPARISGSREVSPPSSIGRLFNSIGRPQWHTNIRMDNPEAKEVYERYIFPLLEYRADQLLEGGQWESMSIARKERVLNDIITEAKADIKASFAAAPSGPRAEAGLIININNLKNQGQEVFRGMLDVFEVDEASLGDLSLPQLQLLFDSIQGAQEAQGRADDAARR